MSRGGCHGRRAHAFCAGQDLGDRVTQAPISGHHRGLLQSADPPHSPAAQTVVWRQRRGAPGANMRWPVTSCWPPLGKFIQPRQIGLVPDSAAPSSSRLIGDARARAWSCWAPLPRETGSWGLSGSGDDQACWATRSAAAQLAAGPTQGFRDQRRSMLQQQPSRTPSRSERDFQRLRAATPDYEEGCAPSWRSAPRVHGGRHDADSSW